MNASPLPMPVSPIKPRAAQVPGSMLHYFAYRIVEQLVTALPERAEELLAQFAADAYFKLDASARESLCANLRAVLGPDAPAFEVRAQARAAFRSFGRYLCEFIGQRNLAPEFLDKRVS